MRGLKANLARSYPAIQTAARPASTEAFDTIGEALRYLHRVAESIAEPPRPAAVPDRIGPVSARRVGNTPVEVMQGFRQWRDVIEGKAKPADEPKAPFPTLEQLVAQLRELGAFAARAQMPSDQKAPGEMNAGA